MKAVMIVGHGSRSLKSQEEFKKIIEVMKQKLAHTKVYGTNMELAEPLMEDTIDEIVKENSGISEIIVVPFFLFEGMHIRKDIPEKLDEFREKYPDIKITFGRPLGADPMIAEVLTARVNEMF